MNFKIEELKKQKVGAKNLFDGNELYQTFQSAVNERNDLILKLKKELSTLKNVKFVNTLQQDAHFANTDTLGNKANLPE